MLNVCGIDKAIYKVKFDSNNQQDISFAVSWDCTKGNMLRKAFKKWKLCPQCLGEIEFASYIF